MESSSFIKLPGELRNRIYELALFHPDGITIRILTGKPQLAEQKHKHILALSSTCKQVRSETSTLLYQTNRFILITRPLGQRYNETIWQTGLRAWLGLIGDGNRDSLSEVEIDIGTSFMYDLQPSSESIWRSVSGLMGLFNTSRTRVAMKTEMNWMSRSRRSFSLTVPLNDHVLAYLRIGEVLKRQRVELEKWSLATRMEPRDLSYRRMELETCGQELRSFVELLETGSLSRLD